MMSRVLRARPPAQQRDDDTDDERQRNRDQGGVLEREPGGLMLEDVHLDRRREIDQEQRGQGTEQHARHSRRRRESSPEDREQERREIPARRNRERQRYHVRHVLSLERDAEHDRDDAENDGRETRNPQLVTRIR